MSMSDTPKLLPCPFCGNPDPELAETHKDHWRVGCAKCGSYNNNSLGQESAIVAWNRRELSAQRQQPSASVDTSYISRANHEAALALVQAELEDYKRRKGLVAIDRICSDCGHDTTEDGCAYCISTQLATAEAELERYKKLCAVQNYFGEQERSDLRARLATAEAELCNIRDANYKVWGAPLDTAEDFVKWAQSRCRHYFAAQAKEKK
jgi:hypothetical protein